MDDSANPKVIEATSAGDLLEKLFQLMEESATNLSSPWVFRGHWDAAWELKPAAWRKDGLAQLESIRKEIEVRWSIKGETTIQTISEIVAVRQFCDLADELGILIPDSNQVMNLDDTIAYIRDGGIAMQIGERDRPMNPFPDLPFAFAQHHRIPTRFLDWTRSALVAAYFAAEGKGDRISGNICVWAANYRTPVNNKCQKPNWVSVPRGYHHFIHAQSGVFLYCGGKHGGIEQPPLDNIPLQKFLLPASKAEDLRQLLFSRYRISQAHLMPTLDNVSQLVRSHWKPN